MSGIWHLKEKLTNSRDILQLAAALLEIPSTEILLSLVVMILMQKSGISDKNQILMS